MEDDKKIDPKELWNLDATIAKFVLPRLKLFKENLNGYPADLSFEKWGEILDKMIYSMEKVYKNCTDEDVKIQEGLDLFAKYFRSLWD